MPANGLPGGMTLTANADAAWPGHATLCTRDWLAQREALVVRFLLIEPVFPDLPNLRFNERSLLRAFA